MSVYSPFIDVICPYCGHKNTVRVEPAGENRRQRQLFVYYCDSEFGGCDIPFVVDYYLEAVVSTYRISDRRTQEAKPNDNGAYSARGEENP
jgi:hypothetical protein